MRKRTIAIIILLLLSITIIGGVTWLFYSRRLVYFNPAKVVCGKSVIDKYNAAADYLYRGDNSEEATIDEAGVKSIVAEIKGNAKSKYDPTCQSILFWAAVREDNYKEAKSAYDIIKSLHDKRIFIDPSLHDTTSLSNFVSSLNGLTGSETEKKEPVGG